MFLCNPMHHWSALFVSLLESGFYFQINFVLKLGSKAFVFDDEFCGFDLNLESTSTIKALESMLRGNLRFSSLGIPEGWSDFRGIRLEGRRFVESLQKHFTFRELSWVIPSNELSFPINSTLRCLKLHSEWQPSSSFRYSNETQTQS